MPRESDNVPAGWYPAPHGGQRYWDGQRWLALPDPDDSTGAPVAVTAGSAEYAAAGRKKVVVASVVALIVLAAAGIGLSLMWKNNRDTEERNAVIAASSSSSKAAAASSKAAADAERAKRAEVVKDVEASVKQLAVEQVNDGLFDGPVLAVTCDPVGGSTDDLTAQTTVFACFVATTDNGDGTFSGERYHARVNWDTGEFTYGFGAPR